MPVAHVGGRERGRLFFLPLPPKGWGFGDDSQLGISADRLLYGTSCLADVQLVNLRADASMFSLPIFFYYIDTSISAEAIQVIPPRAACGVP
jgi:hypothetical protein